MADDINVLLHEMAQIQRGAPEEAMRRIQDIKIPEYSHQVEHIGDILHRMGNNASYNSTRGYANIVPKVRGVAESIGGFSEARGKPYTLLDGMKSQHSREVAAGQRVDKWVDVERELRRLGQIYADEHRKIPVYNEVQYTARNASIALGEFRFEDAGREIKKLEDYLDEGIESWVERASRIEPEFTESSSVSPKTPGTKMADTPWRGTPEFETAVKKWAEESGLPIEEARTQLDDIYRAAPEFGPSKVVQGPTPHGWRGAIERSLRGDRSIGDLLDEMAAEGIDIDKELADWGDELKVPKDWDAAVEETKRLGPRTSGEWGLHDAIEETKRLGPMTHDQWGYHGAVEEQKAAREATRARTLAQKNEIRRQIAIEDILGDDSLSHAEKTKRLSEVEEQFKHWEFRRTTAGDYVEQPGLEEKLGYERAQHDQQRAARLKDIEAAAERQFPKKPTAERVPLLDDLMEEIGRQSGKSADEMLDELAKKGIVSGVDPADVLHDLIIDEEEAAQRRPSKKPATPDWAKRMPDRLSDMSGAQEPLPPSLKQYMKGPIERSLREGSNVRRIATPMPTPTPAPPTPPSLVTSVGRTLPRAAMRSALDAAAATPGVLGREAKMFARNMPAASAGALWDLGPPIGGTPFGTAFLSATTPKAGEGSDLADERAASRQTKAREEESWRTTTPDTRQMSLPEKLRYEKFQEKESRSDQPLYRSPIAELSKPVRASPNSYFSTQTAAE